MLLPFLERPQAVTFQAGEAESEGFNGVNEAVDEAAVKAGLEQVVDQHRGVEPEGVVSDENDFVVDRRFRRQRPFGEALQTFLGTRTGDSLAAEVELVVELGQVVDGAGPGRDFESRQNVDRELFGVGQASDLTNLGEFSESWNRFYKQNLPSTA